MQAGFRANGSRSCKRRVIKDDEDVGIDTNEEEGDKDLTMR